MRYLVLAPAFSLLAFAASEVRGDDSPFNAVSRSLDKWGRNVRQELQEEATPTPTKKRIHHHSSTLQHHASPSPSPSPKVRSKSQEEESEDTPKVKKNSEDDEEDATAPKHAKHRAKSEDSTPEATPEETPKPSPQNQPTAVASLDPSKLKDFDRQPSGVQELIRSALALTQRNLAYTYGSDDPASGGMDCSGFIF